MKIGTLFGCTLAALLVSAAGPAAPADHEQPWLKPDAILILDPFEGNDVDWDKAASDPKLKAVIHQAATGLVVDNQFFARAAEAKRHGLRWGAYLLGLETQSIVRHGTVVTRQLDPVSQADLLVALGRQTGARFLALDIEDVGPGDISLPHAEIFIKRVHELTGRYPAIYANKKVTDEISRRYDANSVFARTPLWYARFLKTMPPIGSRVWADYSVWQFASEINCPDEVRAQHQDALCEPYRPYVVPGVRYDMDVNVLDGGETKLDELFGPAPQ